MLTAYISAAMAHARIEYLAEDACYFGTIPALEGIWADGPTRDACRTTLQEVLEEWIMVSLVQHQPISPIYGFTLAVSAVACVPPFGPIKTYTQALRVSRGGGGW